MSERKQRSRELALLSRGWFLLALVTALLLPFHVWRWT
jgi:hypothetical protein